MIKFVAAFVVAGLVVFGSAAQAKESPKHVDGATTVDATAAKSLFDRGAIFVDARYKKVWRIGHIPNAAIVDVVMGLSERNLMKLAGKSDELVIYCGGPG